MIQCMTKIGKFLFCTYWNVCRLFVAIMKTTFFKDVQAASMSTHFFCFFVRQFEQIIPILSLQKEIFMRLNGRARTNMCSLLFVEV